MQTYSCSVLALLAVCRALAGEPTTNEWGTATNNAQMAVSVTSPWSHTFQVGDSNTVQTPYSAKRNLKAGEPFSLLVRIRNLSTNETLSFYNLAQPLPDVKNGLACVVISPSGKDVSPITDSTVMSGSGGFASAMPNQTIEFEFPLSQLCRLEEIGTYKITARKRTVTNNKAQKAITLTSNTLRVSVVPDK